MKKVLVLISVCLLSVLVLASCAKKTEATKNVESMINGLADVQIDVDSEESLAEIESAYNALSDEEKERVNNYEKLKKAQEEFSSVQTKHETYENMNSAISEIIDAAQAEFSGDDTDYSELMSQAQDVLDKYDELEDEEKENINISEDFSQAVESISSYVASAEESAAAYVKAFNSVYADENYEVTGVYCIKQIRDTTEYHIFALTYKDEAGEEHDLFSNARCSANTNAETIVANSDTFFCERAASDEYNAKLNGNVPLNLETVLSLAE